MRWRLGIDLGAASEGWAAIELDEQGNPCGILAAGSRIFSNGRDPKSGASLAVDRRDARAMRRLRDRYLQRRRALMKYLIVDGLFPVDQAERKALERLDPFALRTAALDRPLPLTHVGRAFWHLNQRRGFKSNRKTDRPDEEAGKIAVGVDRLRAAMAHDQARTLGEWLHMRRQPTEDHPEGLSVRTRLRPEQDKGTGYDFYPDRALVEEEFDEIWNAQAPHHPETMTTAVHDRLFQIVFDQRPLRTPRIGTCTFGSGEPRLAKAHPLFQRRRLLEEVNALRIVHPGEGSDRLTPEQRDALLSKLSASKAVPFKSLRKALRLDHETRFNKESDNRTELKGDEVAAQMAGKPRFGTRWLHLSADEQWEVVARLDAAESDADVAAFRQWLTNHHALTTEQATAVSRVRLPKGHGRFGETVTRGLIDELTRARDPEGCVIVYSEAVARLSLHHSDLRTGEVHDRLPYYGAVLERHLMPGTGDPSDPEEKRIGRLTNPTVHIGLNQLRRTVNRLIDRYGRPEQVAMELARELKLNDEEKARRNRENNENRLAAERRARKLDELEQENTGANRALLKLWEELDGNAIGRQCVYSGEIISPSMLFNGAVEVDHILPFALTLDDSNANKIVCVQRANRSKGRRSPWDAWKDTADWEDIAARATRLPRNKQWRFQPDAMDKFKSEEGFLARHLVDTQYLGVLAREYISSLYSDRGEGTGKVWVSTGRLTEMARRKLGLNDLLPDHNFGGGTNQSKNRLDHRHHAIDAIVIAIIDRSLLMEVARVSGLLGDDARERITIPPPWDNFRRDVGDVVREIVVSHRPDHGTAGHGAGSTAGRLHNDTAYGLTGLTDAKGQTIVVRRKPVTALKPADIETVRDPYLRRALHAATDGLEGKGFEAALAAFCRSGPLPFRGMRRVRLVEPLSVIPVRDRDGRIYKGYKGDSNYRYDIWEMPDGKWRADVVSMFEAHQPGERSRPHPAARRLMRLHRDDIIAIERSEGARELMRVVKFSEKQFALAAPNEGGALKGRDADRNDPFKYVYPSPSTLKSWRARKIDVDEIGQVRDPGFGARTSRRLTRPRATNQRA